MEVGKVLCFSKKKIIFLDIDGVLNSMDWFEKIKDRNEYSEINPEKVKLLKEIVDRTKAEIVLSSTWRRLGHTLKNLETHPKYAYLINTFSDFGLEIFSHTPFIHQNRPEEIKEWIDEHGGMQKNIFVSLDDDFQRQDYEKFGIGDCLVKTSFYEPDGGLRKEHVEKAVKLLNGE